MTEYEKKVQLQREEQRRRAYSRIITATGGGEAREFVIQPLRGLGGPGAFLRYRKWEEVYSAEPRLAVDEFASLTKTQARRLAHALLLWCEESEAESDDPVVLPR
jgi:hypothetical protein